MNYLSLIKALSMIIMFLITMIVGNIPLRLKSFKENERVLALASAFSGGLFLSVGLIHLLPEATESFDSYFEKEDSSSSEEHDHSAETDEKEENESSLDGEGDEHEAEEHEHEDHFPFAMFITVISFSFILMIEKVLTNHEHSIHHHHGSDHDHNHAGKNNYKNDEENQHLHHHHHHHHHNHQDNQNTISPTENKQNNIQELNKAQIEMKNQAHKKEYQIGVTLPTIEFMKKNSDEQNKIDDCETPQNDCGGQQDKCQQNECYNEQDGCTEGKNQNDLKKYNKNTIECSSQKSKNGITNAQNMAKNEKLDDLQLKQTQSNEDASNKLIQPENNKQIVMTPYLIQFAFGIHATLEGLAIGVQHDLGPCLTIALAVLAHKWAEGLVLGLSFKKAGVPVKKSNYMIGLQAVMNPIGIGIGWALSDAGDLASGILMSISAGTFIYIATNEVIVEEFSLQRYKKSKFLLYLIGIGFISALWKLEQITEH